MTGNIYFRNDINKPFPGIFYQVLNLLLSVKAGIFLSIFINAGTTDRRQSGIFPDLNSPSLIIGQMKMKVV
mgnify:CR=1 FL=1